MPKLIIKEACTVAGEEVSRHVDVGDEINLPKDDAILLARMGRALFLEKDDDPTKGTLTASAEDKASIKKQLAAIKAAREQNTANTIDDIVAAAVAKALAAQAAKPATA